MNGILEKPNRHRVIVNVLETLLTSSIPNLDKHKERNSKYTTSIHKRDINGHKASQ